MPIIECTKATLPVNGFELMKSGATNMFEAWRMIVRRDVCSYKVKRLYFCRCSIADGDT